MTNLVRFIAAASTSALLVATASAAPATADAQPPVPGPVAISIPGDASDLSPEALPLFVPTGVAGTNADSPTALVAALADQVRAVATLPQVIDNVRSWIMGLSAGLATVFLTIGGLRYLVAGGNPMEVEKAKGALRSAAVGYSLAVLAPVLVTILKSMVGAS